MQPVGKGAAQLSWCRRDLLIDRQAPLELPHDPAQHGGPVRAVGRRTDVVLQHQGLGVRLPVAEGPVRQQCRLSGARLAGHHQGAVVAGGGMRVQPLQVLAPADVDHLPAAGIGLVVGSLAVKRIGL